MKINKTILAGALALGVVSLAEAGTVYITGSTAMRGAVRTALLTAAPANKVFNGVPAYTAWEGDDGSHVTAGASANWMAFVGNDLSGNPLTIQCHWSGSEAGIKDVAQSLNADFLSAAGSDGGDHFTNVPSGANLISQPVDLALGDNSQAFSLNKTPTLFTNKFVGVITFKWVRNNGLWTGTNVSAAQIKQAFSGACPRAQFDGDSTHTLDYVYVSGRDKFSGTRVNAFGDSGFGIGSLPTQIEIDKATGDMIEVGGLGSGIYSGDYGWDSGGLLANSLGVATTNKTDQVNGGTGYSAIAYLSNGDATTAIAAGAKELTYNGVTFNRNNIIEGTYSMWGNAFMFQRQTPVAGAQAQAVYTGLAINGGIDAAISATGASQIRVGDMHSTRSGPNGVPIHN